MTPRLLFVAYHFPPIGGAGTQRSLKFARYLPSFGFDVTVLTGSGATGSRWTPADRALERELTPEVAIVRTAGEPQERRWKSRVRRWCLLPSDWDRWWIEQVEKSAEKLGDFDLLLATGPPYSTLEAVSLVASRRKRPWLADLRDLWALDEMELYPTMLHRTWEERRMARTLSSAAGVITTAPSASTILKQRLPGLAERVATITNGFDPSDFAPGPAPPSGPKFRIVHTGYLHTEEGARQRSVTRRLLGGARRDVEVLTRSHVFLLQAIEKLLAEDASLRNTLEVQFAGVLSPADREVAAGIPVSRVLGYLPHAESVALLQAADLLFLPMQDRHGDQRSATIPGKTFEYLASGVPILAAVPAGDARDLLAAAGADICAPDDVEGMAAVIRRRFALKQQLIGRRPSAKAAPRQFERLSLTAALAGVLREILGAG